MTENNILDMIKDARYEEAIDILTQILYEDPDNLFALEYIGICYTESGQNDKALKALSYYDSIDSNNADVKEALGCSFFRMENFNRALDLFNEAVKINPDHASAHRNLGVTLNQLGDADGAYEHLNQSRIINPEDYLTIYALATVDVGLKKIEEAKILFSEMLKMHIPEKFRNAAVEYLHKLK